MRNCKKKSEQLLNVNAKPFQIQRGINLKTEKNINPVRMDQNELIKNPTQWKGYIGV